MPTIAEKAQAAAQQLWAIPAGAPDDGSWRAAHDAQCQAAYAAATLALGLSEKIAFVLLLQERLSELQEAEEPVGGSAGDSVARAVDWTGRRACRWGAISSNLPLGLAAIGAAFAIRLPRAWLPADGSPSPLTPSRLSLILPSFGFGAAEAAEAIGASASPADEAAKQIVSAIDAIYGPSAGTREDVRAASALVGADGFASEVASALERHAAMSSVGAAVSLAASGHWDLALTALDAAPASEREAFLAQELGALAEAGNVSMRTAHNGARGGGAFAAAADDEIAAKLSQAQAGSFGKAPLGRELLAAHEPRESAPPGKPIAQGAFLPRSNARALAVLRDPIASMALSEKAQGSRAGAAVLHHWLHERISAKLAEAASGARSSEALASLRACAEAAQLSLMAPRDPAPPRSRSRL